jgi:uncharacterized protein YeeX (DUF496 family)
MKTCPFCKKDVKNIYAHNAKCIRYKSEKNLFLMSLKDKIMELNNHNSILNIVQMLKDDYVDDYEFISWSSISKKIKEWGGIARSISETKKLESCIEKTHTTNIKKYGGTGNVFSSPDIIKKRDETNLARYGVKNIFASDGFKSTILNNEDFWLEKHKMTRKDLISKCSKESWDKLTDSERKQRCFIASEKLKCAIEYKHGMSYSNFISKSQKESWSRLTSEEKAERTKNYITLSGKSSKLEKDFLDILEKSVEVQRQRWLRYIDDDSIISKCYDAHILGSNILIEINGDFWHANPSMYKAEDLLSYPGGLVTAHSIWKRDALKRIIAETHGYTVMYIWESDINKNKQEQIDKIYENCKNPKG